MAGKIYVATQSGFLTVDGKEVPLISGVTRVREGHALIKARPDMFRELEVHYDVETARQAPKSEAKPASKAKAEEPKPEAKTEEGDEETVDYPKPVGLTSDDAPGAKSPRRGPRRVQKTGD